MKLLRLIPQITIQTLYPGFKPKCCSVKIYYKQEYHVRKFVNKSILNSAPLKQSVRRYEINK